MAKITEPRQLFVKELGEMLYVEQELAKEVLPELAKEITYPEFKDGVQTHLAETREHVKNIERAFELLGESAQPEKSRPLDGLKQQHNMIARDIETDTLRDFFNAGAAAKTEHFEISGYRSLISAAESLGEPEIVDLLEQNLDDERKTLKEVEQIAETLAKEPATT